MPSLVRTKSIDELISTSQAPGGRLHRHLGLWSLVALGIGSVIGSGIFTLTGTAAAGLTFDFKSIYKAPVLDLLMHGSQAVGITGRPGAGPGISISFILVALACGFAALCYAELASMIPVAGSAYTYAYATMGEIFAWIIGWDLILEYAVSNMAVAVGFSAYMNDLLENLFGFHLPEALSNPVFIQDKPTGAIFNLPAFLLMMILTWILVRGVRESTKANNIMVVVKLAAILLFVFGAARAINTSNWHPFYPNGFSGVLTGGAIVFFTYIGFVLAAPPLALSMMATGLVFFVFLPSMITTPLAGNVASRFGPRPTFFVSLGLAVAGLPLLLAGTIAPVIAGLAIVGVGTFFAQATATGFVGRAAKSDRAAASGIYLASYYLGGLAGAAVIGQVYDRLGWPVAVGVVAGALLIAAALAASLQPATAGSRIRAATQPA